MPDSGLTGLDLVRVKTLDTYDIGNFPIVEVEIPGYGVALELPLDLRKLFDEGAHVVRINSLELARWIPDFGGKTSGNFSLLPHRDNFGSREDRRRFLILSKTSAGARGSSTLVMSDATATKYALRIIERHFKKAYPRLGYQPYDERFSIEKGQYERCFTKGGYECVVRELVALGKGGDTEELIRLNLLNYLIRDEEADVLMEKVVRAVGDRCYIERWEEGGVVIIDNARVIHARFGGNYPPLKRNFCT